MSLQKKTYAHTYWYLQTASLTAERERANKRVAELEALVQQYQAEQESLEKKLREQISTTEAAKRQTEAVEKELKGTLYYRVAITYIAI